MCLSPVLTHTQSMRYQVFQLTSHMTSLSKSWFHTDRVDDILQIIPLMQTIKYPSTSISQDRERIDT